MMGFFDFFSGKSPEECEQKADSLFENEEYGLAKLEYEKALGKLGKKSSVNPEHKNLLEKKLLQSIESLALEHKNNAENLIESGLYNDAEDFFNLAIELTKDKKLIGEIEKGLEEISDYHSESHGKEFVDVEIHEEEEDEELYQGADEEYLTALLSSLPEAEQDVYYGYGEAFQRGYAALNQGDFETAVGELSQAMEDDPSADSFIPLELATAYLNIGDLNEACSLLDEFLLYHPESLRAYQMKCDVLWENKEFDEALEFLLTCPEELSDSVLIHILYGETLYLSQRLQEAVSFFLEFIETRGWNDLIARSLAKTYETLGLHEKARDLYGEIIGNCQGCGSRIDPFVKQRYADTSFETGDYSTKILELYLELTREDPNNRSHYFQKISRLYSHHGNESEARRYLSFAEIP
ncbi:MAG: tetratricopeptide repeat protein [Desulfobacterales bacterium]|jgi:tetratricopeptide (TPR) repeat protein|nr:tetratricopeptide repeat protein [Desulfobacteraceae bacterium]MBT4363947.1 tetratricopeptide repeat protein [Desulfobacteraceae bacterium]MBT7085924.1 tetratricopeptide repeat protein [Desulfobacterales bacterium]MBT7696890.1 tetratricopeptide repeat protein [Desulfobacterales bacterium]